MTCTSGFAKRYMTTETARAARQKMFIALLANFPAAFVP
jgi:hypothetical protein